MNTKPHYDDRRMLSGQLSDSVGRLAQFVESRIFKSQGLVPLATLIFVTAALRMQQFGKPLLDYHAWRQCDTAAIARNFYRNGLNSVLAAGRLGWDTVRAM